jgi:hypothetical protein
MATFLAALSKPEGKQDFMSAKVQSLAQTEFALSSATLTFSTSYTRSRLAAKLLLEYSAESAIRA